MPVTRAASDSGSDCQDLNEIPRPGTGRDPSRQAILKLPRSNQHAPTADVNHPGALKAPMVGTAYISPEPGKAPFVRLGDTVSNNQPLLIIEAMKVMNTINAPKSGKVVFIGFEDGQPVEFEQLLVIIE